MPKVGLLFFLKPLSLYYNIISKMSFHRNSDLILFIVHSYKISFRIRLRFIVQSYKVILCLKKVLQKTQVYSTILQSHWTLNLLIWKVWWMKFVDPQNLFLSLNIIPAKFYSNNLSTKVTALLDLLMKWILNLRFYSYTLIS